MVYDTLEAKDLVRPDSFASDPEADLASAVVLAAEEAVALPEHNFADAFLTGDDSEVDVMPPSWHVTSDDGRDQGDLSSAVLGPDGKPMSDPEETIARLRKALAEKDYALLQASLGNVELRQELESTKAQAEDLENKLTESLKETESISRRTSEQAASTKGNWRSDADAARMEQQFRIAQKALEKEYARVREELVLTKGELHRANQQVEAQARARRIEAAQASAKIATLERRVEETASAASAAGEALTKHGVRNRIRLGVAAGVAVLMLVAFGIWSGSFSSRTVTATADQHPAASPEGPIHATAYVTPKAFPAGTFQSANAQLLNSQFASGSPAAFSNALSRLNYSLSGMTGRTPEQLLKEVRESASRAGVKVCDFEWNGGQPALIYSGPGGGSLDSSLNRCAAAVDGYLSENGPAAKKPGR